MDKNYRQYNKRASMDSIEVPDVDKIKKLSDKKFTGSGINAAAEQIFNGEKFNKQGEFDRATKVYDDPTVHKEEEAPEDDFIADAAPMPAQAATGLNKGVKVGESYVKRGKIVKWICVAIVIIVLMVFFCPPFFFNDTDKSKVRYDDDVFKTMGMTDFKTYALSNYSVYNEEAFSSELSSNYRFADIVFNVKNPTPFEIEIPQYEISNVSSSYENAVCYATALTTNSDGEVIGDSIPAFSSQEVTVRILVNVTGMTDQTFDDCVTGMILSTSGMKKKIGKNSYLPCLPAFMPVSNATEIYLSK